MNKIIYISAGAAVLATAAFGGVAVATQPETQDIPSISRSIETPHEKTPAPVDTAVELPTIAPAPVEGVPAPAEEPAPAPAPEPVPAPAPAPPDLCPPGTQPNSSDGYNDTSCFPDSCYVGPVSNETHPQCVTAMSPSYYR